MANSHERGAPAGDWERMFRNADVLTDELTGCKGARAKSTKIGKALSPYVGREVRIQVDGKNARAVLKGEKARSNTMRYYFEITMEPDSDPAPTPTTPQISESPAPSPMAQDDTGQETPATAAGNVCGGPAPPTPSVGTKKTGVPTPAKPKATSEKGKDIATPSSPGGSSSPGPRRRRARAERAAGITQKT